MEGVAESSPNLLLDAPPELLSSILLLANDRDVNATLTVSQVSQQLRHTVIHLPLLWTTIDINFPMERNAIYMERSADVLALDIHTSLLPWPMTVEEGVDRIQQFQSLVEPEAHRIRDLHMNFVDWRWLHAAMPILASIGNRKLRLLDIGLLNDYDKIQVPRWSCGIAVSCQPQTLRLRGAPAWDAEDGFWEKVENLYVDSQFSQSASSDPIAAQIERLGLMQGVVRSIEFSDLHFSGLAGVVGNLLVLTALTHLKLCRVNGLGLNALWRQILTPQLESLTMVYNAEPWDETSNHECIGDASFILGIVQANPQLSSLDLTNFQLEPTQWHQILGDSGNLSRLRIAGSSLEYNSLAPLTERHWDIATTDPINVRYYCPLLTHLALENDVSLQSNVVWDIVSSRNGAEHPGRTKLRSVIIRGVDVDNVRDGDVRKICDAVGHFVLETYDVCQSGSEEAIDDDDSEYFSELEVSGDEWYKHVD
ncbi:hypothetical protein FRB93_010924 [Tulasnella sp. JGI-2019a]|nr:hypothetical protein FRB93_010924 [Tulasnella sp. JGI-2019a]